MVDADEGATKFQCKLAVRLALGHRAPARNEMDRRLQGSDKRMAERPIGKLDHIGIAVRSIAEARKFFEGMLGAHFLYEHKNPDAGYTLIELDLNGLIIELLEPLGEKSFVHEFLEKRGEGVHHLTLDVPDSREKIAELKNRGVKIVNQRDFSPESHEAFISPRSSHGVLIQIGSGYPTLARAAEWFKK
jgi:methylmalonyl-CoA/ethylmalonyl-CoA epimerase